MPEPDPNQDVGPRTPKLQFDVYTLFPGMFPGPLDESIIRRARESGAIAIALHDVRDWTTDRHRTADDTPFGGGAGMVMLAQPIVSAVEETFPIGKPNSRVLAMSAGGRLFSQAMAQDLATSHKLAIVCGRYEGIDQRAIDVLGAEEVTIGDFVLTGGELAAMVVIDAVTRLVPGVIDPASISEESHQSNLVEYPHYTRPRVFRGIEVPPILLSGHHAEIARWRREQALRRTARLRPDLIAGEPLTDAEKTIIDEQLALGSDTEE